MLKAHNPLPLHCAGACVVWLLCAGCTGASEPPFSTSAPPTQGKLLIGYYTKDSFNDLQQVPDCPVLWGLQGGNWTMPTLRVQNFEEIITASGTLQCGTETMGKASVQAQLQDRMDGWHELTYLPIPVTHAPPNETMPIDDIYGQPATLSFLLTGSSGAQLSAIYQVTLLRSEVTE